MLDIVETREWRWQDGKREMGRSYIFITCPFCGFEVKAYLWSLAGSGKLCPACKAKHILFGRKSIMRGDENA